MNGVNAYQTAETVSTQGQPLLTMRVVRVTAQLLVILDGRCRRRREADAVAKRLGCHNLATGSDQGGCGFASLGHDLVMKVRLLYLIFVRLCGRVGVAGPVFGVEGRRAVGVAA